MVEAETGRASGRRARARAQTVARASRCRRLQEVVSRLHQGSHLRQEREVQAAVARQVCLRCGQSGHWARQCPSSGEKRKRTDDDSANINMVADADVYVATTGMAQTYNMGEEDSEAEDVAAQDGGAASLLGSWHQIRKYVKYLLEQGVNMDEIKVHPCQKGFRYGNSQLKKTKLCVVLPTYGWTEVEAASLHDQRDCPHSGREAGPGTPGCRGGLWQQEDEVAGRPLA